MVKKAKQAAAAAPTNPALAAWPFPKSPPTGDQGTGQVVQSAADPLPGEEVRELPPMGERIRVDQVRLFTDTTQNVIERIELDQLRESPFNPRTKYDAKALQDLAETIRGVGVAQPLLVRKLSVDGLLAFNKENPEQAGNPPPYEVVFGHRRFRGARLAGETHVPAIVRELTDAQSAQLQAIENVQRQNPDPIDEGRGYQHYIKVHRVSADQLADEIGMSRTHVYNRIKLLNAVAPVQEALRAGEIDSEVALLIARLHSPKIQEKALASLKSQHHDLEEGGRRSYRGIKHFLQERFTLKLKEAVFPTDDATLLEGADACTTCPKRSGNAIEYSDVAAENHPYSKGGPNLCTDPECWDAKHKRHLSNEAMKLVAKGKTVIEGGRARQAIGADGQVKGAYIALKEVKAELSKAAKGRKTLAGNPVEFQVVVIQDPRTGKTVEAVKRDEVKTAGVKVKEAPKQQGRGSWEEENRKRAERQAKDEAKAEEIRRVNYAVLGAVRQAAAGQPLPTIAVQMVARVALAGVEWQDKQAICALYGVKNEEALVKQIGSMPVERLTTLLLDCALVHNVHTRGHTLNEKADALEWAADHYGIDVEEIRSDLAKVPADTATQELQPAGDDQVAREQEQEQAEEAAA